MNYQAVLLPRALRFFVLSLLVFMALHLTLPRTQAQDPVTGAFEGTVTDSQTNAPIAGATVQFINQSSGVPLAKRSNQQGGFYQGLLPPGIYIIRVSAPNYQTKEVEMRLLATRNNSVIPVPVTLDPESLATVTPTPTATPVPGATPTPTQAATQVAGLDTNILADINTKDARHSGAFTEEEVSTLPLGGTTLVRSFDELALLLPGVAAPPQPIGSGTGPGVGAGVGTSGQFAVNGLRSRANNFTVDGSDNNDEDIGVRRQGFFSLVPQPIESIKEFQVITLLAPAQFGRNIGAQVNAISKSGGNGTHGTLFGFFNSSQLNAPNAFDSANGNATSALRSGNQDVIRCTAFILLSNTCVNSRPITVTNGSGGEDSFTLAQGGMVLGGPLVPDKMFYFISVEGQNLNATQEANFAVPTVAQRGLSIPGTAAANGSGATGIFINPFTGAPTRAFPTAAEGDAIFSLFPFPNNPNGIYRENTFTQTLPADSQGKVASAKLDSNFNFMGRQHSFTARYNFTGDYRTIPVTGNAIFSSLRPRVRTQNFSTFLNTELSSPNSASQVNNQLRLSYGRTRLNFEEVRDTDYQLRSRLFPSEPFLLNTPLLQNFTVPPANGVPNTGAVPYLAAGDTESDLGPVGQVIVAGFSPVGVDVFNFPQRRVNNTYQVADTVTWRKGNHSFAFGTDIRRTELNSDLARNSRPLITFNGGPDFVFDPVNGFSFNNQFISPLDFVSSGAASGSFQTLVTGDNKINLRYYQLDFFAQDEWRIRPNLSLSYGLRYEYNSPPQETSQRIESTFTSPAINLAPGLNDFIDGRREIFDPDRNNFAPRVGIAYSPNLFGPDRTTVIRAGYGLFYDQILGAVVSQSRSVFPNSVTVNLAGGLANVLFDPTDPLPFASFSILNASSPFIGLVQPGTLNTLNTQFTLQDQIEFLNLINGGFFLPNTSSVAVTLPARNLESPLAHHYSVSFEQQLGRNTVVSAAYVGTLGRNLLRFTTPNLGPNFILLPVGLELIGFQPGILGVALPPGINAVNGDIVGGRPLNTVGAVNIFETTASSRYDALQLQMRGRFSRGLQYQVNYTFSKVDDDVSDVFDLAGASALPQNSNPASDNYLAGERGPANFDVRHRFSYNLIYEFPEFRDRSSAFRFLFGGLQFASTGQFHTGQPFTVNSIFDVNLDGNLTDRLDNTNGIVRTGNRRQPLMLTGDPATLRAAVGQDGRIGRNTFRAGNVLELDLSLVKKFAITERQSLTFRMDIFNFIDRANYGIPVRYLEAPGFGQAVDTVTPGRRIQFALKYTF